MHILDPPVVTNMSNLEREEETRFIKNCTYTSGVPTDTNISWIRSSDNRTWDSYELVIDSLNRTLDNAMFTCRAKNIMLPTGGTAKIGRHHQSFRMNILCKFNFLSK